jgi:hypothetical protein
MGKLTEGLIGGGGGSIPPGSTRMIDVKDKSGNIIKTLTVYRTDRDYAYDLADAYNDGLDPSSRQRGLQWFVGPSGELKLGDNSAWSRSNLKRIESRTETERARYLRHTLTTQPGEAE